MSATAPTYHSSRRRATGTAFDKVCWKTQTGGSIASGQRTGTADPESEFLRLVRAIGALSGRGHHKSTACLDFNTLQRCREDDESHFRLNGSKASRVDGRLVRICEIGR